MAKNSLLEIFPDFEATFAKKMEEARKSGAVPEDMSDVALGRCVLVIVAESYEPYRNKFVRSVLSNLRYFI